MTVSRFDVVRGEVASLHVWQDDQDFVAQEGDSVAGGIAVVGLAAQGLAGAATSAAISSGSTADRVDFFTCSVGSHVIRGRFGKVTFQDGDLVEVVVQSGSGAAEAFAVVRPADRTMWLHPHCGRGTNAHLAFSVKWVGLASWVIVPIAVYLLALLGDVLIGGTQIPIDAMPWVVLANGILGSIVFGMTAVRFRRFARLSDEIFAALGFEKPAEVDLHRHLREASKEFSNENRLRYHPHARWVYKY